MKHPKIVGLKRCTVLSVRLQFSFVAPLTNKERKISQLSQRILIRSLNRNPRSTRSVLALVPSHPNPNLTLHSFLFSSLFPS